MDDNYLRLLEEKVNNLEKKYDALYQDHKTLETSHNIFVIFTLIVIGIAVYFLFKVGLHM